MLLAEHLSKLCSHLPLDFHRIGMLMESFKGQLRTLFNEGFDLFPDPPPAYQQQRIRQTGSFHIHCSHIACELVQHRTVTLVKFVELSQHLQHVSIQFSVDLLKLCQPG